jgi:hypothetical protein
MRVGLVLLLWLIGSCAYAQPGPAEAAAELKLFLEQEVRSEHRIVSFQVVGQPEDSPNRRFVRYEARVEFPTGLSPMGRQVLRNESVRLVEGKLQELSSRKVVLDLTRVAKFRRTPSGWAAIVGTTRFLLQP